MVALVALAVAFIAALAVPLPARQARPRARASSPTLSARAPRPKFVGTKMGVTVEVTHFSNLDLATVKIGGLPFGDVSGTAFLDSERNQVVFEPTFHSALRSCRVEVLSMLRSTSEDCVDVRACVIGLPMLLRLHRSPAL